MKKGLFVSILVLIMGGFFSSVGVADDTLAEFKGGIGVIPVSSGVGTAATATTVNRNIVRGVNPPGQIWTIKDLDAKIGLNGGINVEGKGLILAGGNNVGRTTGQNVFATLICEAAAPFTEHSTSFDGVPLAPNGDFEIDDVLTPIPTDCASPMLLIRTTNANSANRNWFAAGIPKTGKGDD
jgi:hypothetical protein